MNIIYDICDDILLETSLIDILTKYDDFNIKMLNFIKSKNKLYFELLDKYIINELNKDISKLNIKKSLISKITNMQLLDFIIDNSKIPIINIFNDDFKITLEQSEEYLPLIPLILNQSQNQVLNYYKSNSVCSGIIAHATGTGKTNCIYITMGFNEPNVIFILCTYKTILKQLFYKIVKKENNIEYILDYEKFRQLKYGKFLDLWTYSIYNLADDTIDRKALIKALPNINKLSNKKIFLINPQFITIEDRFTLLPKPDIIIHDECHSITADNTFKILSYFKSISDSIPIIGLSATPIRYIKKRDNYDKIDNIYTSNIISSYENIKAIINGDILNIEFFWFDAKLNNKKSKSNIDNLINKILQIYDRLPNKKILIWCGTIDHTTFIYNIFNNHPILKTLFNNILIDHSKITEPETKTFELFKSSKEKAILFCAEKYREGTDIEYLDCIVFADMVKTKSDVPFIQSIGRVQRTGYNKTIGYVIDHYEKSKEKPKTDFIINKLIRYYYEFFFHSNNNTDNNIEKSLNEYTEILQNISFTNNNLDNIINIKINNEMSIKIHLNISQDDFNDIEFKFDSKIREHIAIENNLQENEMLKLEYDAFKIINRAFKIKNKVEYNNLIDKYCLNPKPEIKYKNIWKNWYDYFGIDTSIYPANVAQLQLIMRENKIRTVQEYNKKCEILNMPSMPEELYKDFNSANVFNYNTLIL